MSGDGITRDEVRGMISDKLEASEARTDAKFAELSGKLDVIVAEIRHQSAAVTETKRELETVSGSVESHHSNTRTTIIVTAVATVIALAALVYAADANLLSAFQSGLAAVSTVTSK